MRTTAFPLSSTTDSSPGQRRRLLVVDDDADTADILGRLLRRAGYDVTVAHDCSEARTELKRGKFDGLVTDLDLPDGHGHGLLAPARAAGLGVAIVLSGFHRQDDKNRSLDAGFDAHFVKPVDPKALLRLLVELFATKGQEQTQ